MGADFELRKDDEGSPFVTDGGHYILDCGFPGGLEDPESVDRRLHELPPVVETGLFLGMADTVVVGTDEGPRVLSAENRR
jgi:ribose 5-phosphate isomerase A